MIVYEDLAQTVECIPWPAFDELTCIRSSGLPFETRVFLKLMPARDSTPQVNWLGTLTAGFLSEDRQWIADLRSRD